MSIPGEDDPQAELLALLADEFREGGLTATVMPGRDGAPAQLVTPIGSSPTARQLRIHTYFLPDVDDPPVLQYFVPLPYAIVPSAHAGLASFVCALNAELPLTGFETSERSGVVVFRHTHAIGIRPLDPGIVAWTLSMIGSAIESFGPLVEEVAGGADPNRAAAGVAERFAALSAD